MKNEQAVGLSDFDGLTSVHDGGAPCLGNHAQVVGDHQHRGVLAMDQIGHQVEHLALDGDVEPVGGVIGDDQLRCVNQRHRDDDALGPAAAEFRAGRSGRRAGSGRPTAASMVKTFSRSSAREAR